MFFITAEEGKHSLHHERSEKTLQDDRERLAVVSADFTQRLNSPQIETGCCLFNCSSTSLPMFESELHPDSDTFELQLISYSDVQEVVTYKTLLASALDEFTVCEFSGCFCI